MPEPTTIQQALDLALQHHVSNRLAEAERVYRQILQKLPDDAEALHGLGLIALQVGRTDAAVELLRQAVALQPRFAEAHNGLGIALRTRGQSLEAIATLQRAIALRSGFPEAWANLGNALRDIGQLSEAIAAYRHAIVLNPRFADACVNLGIALGDQGEVDDAIAAYRHAMSIDADGPRAHFNLARALLLLGDFRGGWEEYEWRWKCHDFPSARWNYVQPQWDGSKLNGRIILLHAEQGLGDTIQFIRYVPLVAGRGGQVIFRCKPQLRMLLEKTAGIAQWLTPDDPLPGFDVHCPLLSLPRVLGTTLETIPGGVPYLYSDPQRREVWQNRLVEHSDRLNAGLVWAGGPAHSGDRERSMDLARVAPLLSLSGVRFFSLQKGATGARAGGRSDLIDWTAELADIADTAALIDNLDLVITVDTAVAHLAGALGKPVWVMLPFAPDWRWMLHRDESPWYPTMRLFRQKSPRDWNSVVDKVADALAQLRRDHPPGTDTARDG